MSADDEIRSRLAERTAAVVAGLRAERTISSMRIAVFALFIAFLWTAFVMKAIAGWWSLLPLLLFLVLIVQHDRLVRRRGAAERAVHFYETGLAHLENRWSGAGETGQEYFEALHPYAGDLDIFGRGSLFERLSFARSGAGNDRLAEWLMHPAAPDEITARQNSARELSGKLNLREDLAVLAVTAGKRLQVKRLTEWGSAPSVKFTRGERISTTVLSAFAVISVLLAFPALVRTLVSFTNPELVRRLGDWGVLTWASLAFVVVLPAKMFFTRRLRERVQAINSIAERAGDDLATFAKLLERIEREQFTSPKMSGILQRLKTDGESAFRRIASLTRLIDLLESRRNQFFIPFAALLSWQEHLAFAIERWRTISGRSISVWIDSVAEAEALSAFAALTFERPDFVFPDIAIGSPRIEARSLGHPLIDPDRCVRNDLSLGNDIRLLIVSGSNMSGKSTMLRTVGTNAVLAFAGAPVFAERMTITPLLLGSSIRVDDSLQEGSSRFYAEITRLRQIVDLATAGPDPLLFLLDEIMHGTNSHDRRIGAEAVVGSLMKTGAIGMITTHDLALARMAERTELAARNVHFEDQIAGGRISFDYTMRDGVVTRSNALELMRAVGLDVGTAATSD